MIKRALILCMLLAAVFSMAGCSPDPAPEAMDNEIGNTGICVYPELVKVDLEYYSDTLSFPLIFVSDRKLGTDEIQFKGLKGENTDYFRKTTMTLRQIPNVTEEEINGSYLYAFSVKSFIDGNYFSDRNVRPPDVWEITINAVVAEISGTEYTIPLQYPVKYHYNEQYNDVDGNYMYGPITVFAWWLSESYSASIHNYEGGIFLKDFSFSRFLEAEDVYLLYDNNLVGGLDAAASYEIPQRVQEEASRAWVYFTPVPSGETDLTEFDYILCTSILSYSMEGDGAVYNMRFPFNAQGIVDRQSAENFLSFIAGEQAE